MRINGAFLKIEGGLVHEFDITKGFGAFYPYYSLKGIHD